MFSKILFPSLIFFLATSLTLTIACDIPILPPQHLFHIPSWQTQNFTCSAPPEVYIIKPSPNKGLGPHWYRTSSPDGRRCLEAMMSSSRTAFFSLSGEDQSLYLSLHAHVFLTEALNTEEDYLMPISRSNAFNTGDSFGLSPKVARINHSCRPNAVYFWSQQLGKRIVYAASQINKGEEILVSHIPLLRTKAERAMRLHQYGFKCECEACAAGMGDAIVSDSRRTEIRQLIESLESELSAKVGLGLVGLVEAERLVDYSAQAYRMASLSHGRIELWEEGANWALKSLEHREMADKYSPEANEMREVAASFILHPQAYMKPGSQ
ncbi:uncharacterized protein K441DRAFT_685788 [Cenococcum geophilum 1.58]|uniref:uncharacterized protein n=1 Tax=Cenococcum geophilum 1.58 TaxID=794803 RepID=UPI00358E070C|nr:hypothetical protein K441DRAFT_685788 [Cenococcum geophilum 1.58]